MSLDFYNEVNWFAWKMREKLGKAKNLKKRHWTEETFQDLLCCLVEEVVELHVAFRLPSSNESLISECCDVANFAMMIADKVRKEMKEEK